MTSSAQDTTPDPVSPYTIIQYQTIPLPVITVQGTVTPKGVVNVKLFQIRALRGSVVKIACKGSHCPFKHSSRTMLTSTLRVKSLERKLKPKMTLTFRIRRQSDDLGKYMEYKIRKNKAPVRTDMCLQKGSSAVVGCFTG